MISASWDSTAIIWDVTKNLKLKQLKSSSVVSNVKFSGDAKRSILISGHDISIWDNSTGVELMIFVVHGEERVVNAEFMDDQTLISVGLDGTLKIYPLSVDAWHKKAIEFAHLFANMSFYEE